VKLRKMAPKTTRAKGTGVITPSSSLGEATDIIKAMKGAIKDPKDAKSFLVKEGWFEPEETISLETLARILFAHALSAKIAPETANTLSAVAHLITTKLQDGVAQGVASTITELLKHSIASMTVDIRDDLKLHASKLAETAQAQATIAQEMQQTQENMAESARQAATQVRTYSQAVTTPPLPQSTSPHPITHSQLQIQNREQIKRRQVLIDFEKTEELQLEVMDEKTITRKAADALRTIFAVATDPKPAEVKLKSGTLLRNGGLLIELNSNDAACWLKSEGVIDHFLENLGSGASVKNRTYQVIVQFVPISFDPTDDEQIREYESHNNIAEGSIAKAEWIKPIKDRRGEQTVATMRVYHRDAESANAILKQGAYVFNKRVVPKRPHKEPIRCLRCHKFGHERRECRYQIAYCGKCSKVHETEDCRASRNEFQCVNCFGPHPSYSRECPKFWEKCQQMDQRCPENGLAFYPTDESWTWVTLEHAAIAQPPPPQPPNVPTEPTRPQRHPLMRQNQLTGSNSTPLGLARNNNPQPDGQSSQ
jgi:hypothetical protein